ncbi:carboxymuconolactone decarboxylase family protein [Arthrobacter sp. ISL-30]|uniref:carboxymuconolactone decarboxylase family protein n=1 Tax=Arthrobacter sp. ISL-30 TaxID=2819109 RepID=UPI001BE8AAC4|nr:carboxymuconolactone decarboxylase family protein [Arthrobacter sp. ISL-30]MBT2514801.1 carboxymuconolactone decarboxylase family protein [Arthrobacter sp. ISL-30]
MTIRSSTPHTNVAVKHPELYNTLNTVSGLANQAALAEGLSPLLTELIKIRVSQINGCAYCLRIHTHDSLAQGESPERLAVLPAWRESMYFNEQERSALALAEYITAIEDSHLNAGLYESAAAHLTPGQVSAVTWVTMTTNTYNRIAISSAYTVAPRKTARL